jgi:hypothetical protein
MNIKSAGLIATLGIVLSIQPARADVVIGTAGPANTGVSEFGLRNSNTFGELFTAPITGTLSSFTLDLTSSIGNLIGGVGVWNGSGVSSILYTSPVTASALTNTFAPNISVVAGTEYVAFLSVEGVSGASGTTTMPAISPAGSAAFLDGFVFNSTDLGTSTYASSTWSAPFPRQRRSFFGDVHPRRPRALHLGDAADRVRWHWLHGLSSEVKASIDGRLIYDHPI